MLIFGALTLALLFVANQRLHASYLHPACIFTGYWFALLTGLILAGDAFNPISDGTVIIYLAGALSFTLGGRLVTRSAGRSRLTQPAFEIKRIGHTIDAGIGILLALVPLYWSRLTMIAESSAYHVFLTGVRAAMVEDQKGSFGMFTYILPCGMLLSFMATAIDDGSRRARIRTVAIIAITVGYYAVTGSRLGSELTLIGVASIGCLRSKRLHVGRLLLAASLLLVIFTVPAIILNKGGDSRLSVSDNPSGVAASLRLYLLGGLVAFDQVVTGSAPYMPADYSLRPFYRAAKMLGSTIEVPPQNFPFTQVPESGNVYTIYCGYYLGFGVPGVCIAMLIIGMALAWTYEHARSGSIPAVVFYGLGVASILISSAADPFLVGISFNIQAGLFVYLVFLVARLAPRRQKQDRDLAGSFVLSRANSQPQRYSVIRCLPLE